MWDLNPNLVRFVWDLGLSDAARGWLCNGRLAPSLHLNLGSSFGISNPFIYNQCGSRFRQAMQWLTAPPAAPKFGFIWV